MFSLINYSSLNASIGLILTALSAGIRPISVPSVIIVINAPNTIARGTVGFVKGNSSKFAVPMFITNNKSVGLMLVKIVGLCVKDC